jgi:hypothetical protein
MCGCSDKLTYLAIKYAIFRTLGIQDSRRRKMHLDIRFVQHLVTMCVQIILNFTTALRMMSVL